MLERFLDQIGEVLRLCEDTDGILVVNREGIIEYHRIPLNSYWCSQDTVGRHILELYPELDGESSTILTALRTGRASYNVLQDINNHRGERVLLESTTIPIVVDGRVECVVDSSKYHTIDQRVIRGGEGGGLSTLDRMLTEDPAMLALKSRIRDVAGLDSSVLIYGETGTGKELVAESLHSEGGRAGPFVSQNCAAIPATLLESLFFGTEKGSYTGALTRKGLLEEADGGTLFLDEINSMDPALQAKLLKVLEEMELCPNDLYVVFTVQEEVGLRGAKPAAWAVDPDYAVVVDVTDVDDTPGSEKCGTVRLGKGPAIKIMDSSVICHPDMIQKLESQAKTLDMRTQRDIMRAGGTDAGVMHTTRIGVRTGGVSVPCRYIHTPVEMADLQDARDCAKLLCAFVQSKLESL